MNLEQIEFIAIKEYLKYYLENNVKQIIKKDNLELIRFKINNDDIIIGKDETSIFKVINKKQYIILIDKLSLKDKEFIKVFFSQEKIKTINEPLTVLKNVFGYSSFRQEQEFIINAVLNGEDALVLMPTGGGKSLCYQIPALCLDGIAVVVSPLISLMQDQVMALKELGVNAEFLNSSLDKEDYIDVLKNIKNTKMLYISPEKFNSDKFKEFLQTLNISFFAIDEAHCVSKWGHDFRPDYIKLSAIKQIFNKPILALTATADLNTREDIPNQLKMQNYKKFVSNFDRPNIKILVENKDNYKKQLIEYLKNKKKESGIIYCLSRKKVEEICEFLTGQGFNAFPYHAGLDSKEREKNQDKFIKSEQVIMVATIAFGMGINKSNVRYVIHLDMPNSIESYYQEIGRAGRDGENAESILFYGMQDFIIRAKMNFDGDSSKKMQNMAKLNEMLAFSETTSCKRNFLMKYFGNKEVNCNNCSSCLMRKDLTDVSELAKNIIETIKNTGEFYAISYISSLLKGSNAKNIKDKHKSLKHYNSFSGDESEIKMVIRQLIVLGILEIDLTNDFNALKIKKQLNESVYIYKHLKKKNPDSNKKSQIDSSSNNSDSELFEKLRQARYNLAKEKNIPPYIILQDKTLVEMASKLPRNKEELKEVNGWGDKKIELYSELFLTIISQHLKS
jgi:ATP-dependent DNA helicase RecQ